jgi:uncharacterized protein (DUF4415 family)
VQPIRPEEQARYDALAEADTDAPAMSESELAELRPMHEVMPDLAATPPRLRGRPRKPEAEKLVAVKLHLDRQTLETFKAGGPGWQTRMREVLSRSAKRQRADKRRA